MGVLIYKDWARLLALTAGIYSTWANIWGLFYRKFFWDMIGGVLGPAGLIPPKSSSFFIAIIVTAPVLQIINILFGLFTLGLEWPLPFLKGSSVHRSHVFRLVFYFFCAFFDILVYQSVDSALFYLVTVWAYWVSSARGESLEDEAEIQSRANKTGVV